MSTGKNTKIPYLTGSPQYDYIKSDQYKAASDKNIDWIIVYGYRPFYSSPSAHNAAGALRDTYSPLFERYGVDLVITAHNHNYQRTYPILYNPDNPKNPIVKDKQTSSYHNPGGTIYVTVGTAGVNLYDLLGQAPFVAKQFKNSGFLNVDLPKDNLAHHFAAHLMGLTRISLRLSSLNLNFYDFMHFTMIVSLLVTLKVSLILP